ncbi:MAG: hypothetical protein JWM61_1698 [Micrococcaceae bacterium]|jgi:hypothetical protein|nr:hypothetical protein [Micrococcaceae bacterium]
MRNILHKVTHGFAKTRSDDRSPALKPVHWLMLDQIHGHSPQMATMI